MIVFYDTIMILFYQYRTLPVTLYLVTEITAIKIIRPKAIRVYTRGQSQQIVIVFIIGMSMAYNTLHSTPSQHSSMDNTPPVYFDSR